MGLIKPCPFTIHTMHTIIKEGKKEIKEGKIYSPVGNLAERAKQITFECILGLCEWLEEGRKI